MNRTIIFSILTLTAAYLLGIPKAQVYMTIATAVFASIGAVIWLFSGRPPTHFTRNLLLVFIGPIALVAILNMLTSSLHNLEGHTPSLLLLCIIALSAFLGYRFLGNKSQRLF